MRNHDVHAEQSGPAAPARNDAIELAPGVCFPGVRMRFARNEEIFGEGEPAEYVYRVVSGAVRTMRFTADGRRQILAFHLPGDLFGLELGDAHGFSAEAVGETDIVMVRAALVRRRAAEDAAVAGALLALGRDELLAAREHALLLGRKGASERVAAFLLRMADRAPRRGDLELPMSRADIADHLGLTIESVSRSFSEMERQSAIALPSSRHVVMQSRSALALLEAA